jgi:tRNA uridine 5-carboxymethylaminomethyl modification enzyme
MQRAIFDVIVVGGGHAGCEAAAAAARMGARTALITHRFDTVGEMSAIPLSGLGGGHLVRDRCAGRPDGRSPMAGIQFRLLNRSKGPGGAGSARPGRSQSFAAPPQAVIRATPNLEVIEAAVATSSSRTGASLASSVLAAKRSGRAPSSTRARSCAPDYYGEREIPAGRVGAPPALGLSDRFCRSDCLGRLKTGRRRGSTAADRRASLQMQAGDDDPVPPRS